MMLVFAFFFLHTSWAYPQTLSEAEETAKKDLEDAIVRLSKLRSEIAAEKIPLAQRISAKENSLLNLRSTAAKIQAAKDSKTLGLEDIRRDLQLWEDENNFLVNLLDEYARRFENNINIAEQSIYQTELAAFNNLDLSRAGEGRLVVQMKLIDLGFARLRNALDGDVFHSKVINDKGVLTEGTVARFGPTAFFMGDGNGVNGIIVGDGGDIPHLFTDEGRLQSNLPDLLTGQTVQMPIDVTNGKAISIEADSDTLFSHIAKGGVWIVPILTFACLSIIASALKFIQIYKIKLPEKGSLHQILSKLKDGDNSAAAEAAKAIPYPIGDMLTQGVIHYKEPKELVEEVMYESVLETQPKLEKYLPLIAICAATAPLLGLLGTVTGMINTFQLITLFGTGDAQSLSSGISEALITTEFGLIVAIPALIMHALLSRKVAAVMSDMEKFAVIFVNGLPRLKV